MASKPVSQRCFHYALGAILYACTPGAFAADEPMLDWFSSAAQPASISAPLAIVISQPAPSLIFANHNNATRVQLAITQAANHAARLDDGLLQLIPGLATGSGLVEEAAATSVTWSMTLEMEQATAQSLAALGQIHCRNGYLSAAGYTASDCQVAPLGGRMRLGGSISPLPGVKLGMGLFNQSLPSLSNGDLTPREQGGINANLLSATPLDAVELGSGVSSGVDVGLSLNSGDLDIGRFRVDVAMFEYLQPTTLRRTTAYDFSPPWLSINDLQRQTRLHLGWTKGAFSGGVEGIYQVYQPGLINTPGNDWSTFNLYFSWNTPWKGRFSIGATNVLDSSLTDLNLNQPDPRQPLDGIFGRVPYVRYKQDL